jgi:hypothetical protein
VPDAFPPRSNERPPGRTPLMSKHRNYSPDPPHRMLPTLLRLSSIYTQQPRPDDLTTRGFITRRRNIDRNSASRDPHYNISTGASRCAHENRTYPSTLLDQTTSHSKCLLRCALALMASLLTTHSNIQRIHRARHSRRLAEQT